MYQRASHMPNINDLIKVELLGWDIFIFAATISIAQNMQSLEVGRRNTPPFQVTNGICSVKTGIYVKKYWLTVSSCTSNREHMLKLSVSDNRASSGCSCACVLLSPPATQLLQAARGMCNVSRAGGESVWPASISAKRLDSRGHVFGTVTVFALRERMKIVCSFKYGAAEEGKSLQKVRSDDGVAIGAP